MKMVKQMLLMIALVLTSVPIALAQDEAKPKATLNTAYFELLGNGYLYSFNYEREFFGTPKISYSARVGVSYFNVLNSGIGGGFGLRYRFFPVTLNMVRHFNKNNLEVGLGLTNEISNDEADKFVYNFVPTLHTGYRRYMGNNIDFRAGVNLSRADLRPDDNYEVLPWPYLSFGKKF